MAKTVLTDMVYKHLDSRLPRLTGENVETADARGARMGTGRRLHGRALD
jgi:hypothetical protein